MSRIHQEFEEFRRNFELGLSAGLKAFRLKALSEKAAEARLEFFLDFSSTFRDFLSSTNSQVFHPVSSR
jgi:hypothetical protein